MALDIAWFIILAHVIMSWLINFRVLNLQQLLVAQMWHGINRLVNPVYSRIRQFLPNTGGLDFADISTKSNSRFFARFSPSIFEQTLFSTLSPTNLIFSAVIKLLIL